MQSLTKARIQSHTQPGLTDEQRVHLRGSAPHALIGDDGRMVALTPALLADLGFSHCDDISGLAFASLWHHAERPAVDRALRAARAGKPAEVELDLSYVTDADARCRVELRPIDGAIAACVTCPD